VLLPPSQTCKGTGSIRVGYGKYDRLHVEATLGREEGERPLTAHLKGDTPSICKATFG